MQSSSLGRLPLGLDHPDTQAALRLYADRFDKDHRAKRMGQEIYAFFASGNDFEWIAATTGMSYSWVRLIYEQVFQEKVFGGLAYTDYRAYLLADERGIGFPRCGILDFAAAKLREQGYVVGVVTNRYGKCYTRLRALLVNGAVAPVHWFFEPVDVLRERVAGWKFLVAVELLRDGPRVTLHETEALLAQPTKRVWLGSRTPAPRSKSLARAA